MSWFKKEPPLVLDTIKKPEGLEVIFQIGQKFPWSGIWFEIIRVDKERIELAPVGLTWKRNKKIKEAQHGR